MNQTYKTISVINCGIRKNGRTNSLTNAFIEGMRESTTPIIINRYNIAEWNISPCDGCASCWFETGSICKIEDDFSKNKKQIFQSDLLILSTPIWNGNSTHLFRNFTERMFSIITPFFVKTGAYYGHNRVDFAKANKIFLISTCALPGKINFKPVLEHLTALGFLFNLTYSGALLQSQSLEMNFIGDKEKESFYTFCKNEGREYITNFEKQEGPTEILLPVLFEVDNYIEKCNQWFKERK